MKKVKGDWGMGIRTKCPRCGRFSYGFLLCSWCRRKANEGRVIDGRFVMWNRNSKVFELLTAEEVKEGAWKRTLERPKTRPNNQNVVRGLCGRASCSRFCVRACHCVLGQERAKSLLAHYRYIRIARRRLVSQVIDARSEKAAGSFEDFSRQLRRENGRLFAETVRLKAWYLEQVKALPEVKLLPPGKPVLALPFPWFFVNLGLHAMEARDKLEHQEVVLADAFRNHCRHLQFVDREVRKDVARLDAICARQARYYQRWENRSSLLRWTDILNPVAWIKILARG